MARFTASAGGSVHRLCDGSTRRDFLRVGGLALGGFGLADLLRARAAARDQGRSPRRSSVVWLWLGGGPTHIETFDPKPTAPAEYRSMLGAIDTAVPGVQIGGLLPRVAQAAQRMAFVRSFAHTNSGHSGGTHFVMTGYDHKPADQGAAPVRPSLGSILSRHRGASHPQTGIPTYIRLNNTYADGPAWLGAGYAPFDTGGQTRRNMELRLDAARLADRRSLLDQLDRINRRVDGSGLMDGMDQFETQAFDLIQGGVREAFDVQREDARTRERYGKGLGEQLLVARRLCEAGCGFVTVQYGGWDMHRGLVPAMQRLCPALDQAVAAFVGDTHDRGLADDVLLVITGEFGRTPRINSGAGRDHWAPLSTLALAGGGLQMGQVIGASAAKGDVPHGSPITPQDLMATVFHVLDIPGNLHFTDPRGRPTAMVSSGRPIAGLV